MSMQAPEHNHLAVHTVLFPKCFCIHVWLVSSWKKWVCGSCALGLMLWSSRHESFLRCPCCMWTLLCSRAHAMVQAGGWQPGGIYKTKVMRRTKLAAFNWRNRAHIQQSSKKTLEEKKESVRLNIATSYICTLCPLLADLMGLQRTLWLLCFLKIYLFILIFYWN